MWCKTSFLRNSVDRLQVFGWIEFVGGVIKLVIVIGVILLMFLINGGGKFPVERKVTSAEPLLPSRARRNHRHQM